MRQACQREAAPWRGPRRRPCLKCRRIFLSEGAHHRICRTCKRVRSPDEPEPDAQLDIDASNERRERGLRLLMDLPLRERGLGRFFTGADLGFRTCQWITGEPSADEACKCGRSTVRGASYCARHRARACFVRLRLRGGSAESDDP